MESIYISICCLGIDQELEHTVNSAMNNSEDESRIYFGITIIGNKEFFDYIVERTSHHSKNIKIQYFDLEDNFGIGRGRILANTLYNNQDYILQIDAHSRFSLNWDTNLIDSFKKALDFTNNPKTILTGCPGPYSYIKNNDNSAYPVSVGKYMGYPVWQKDQYMLTEYSLIPKWEKVSLFETNNNLVELFEKNGFAPSPKISAAFIFSNSEFIKNQGINQKHLFWEEEILQSIELINSGFTLLHLSTFEPIYHLYGKDIVNNKGYRDTFECVFDLNIVTKNYFMKTIKNNFSEYLSNPDNKYRIKRFEEYAKINLSSGLIENDPFPDTYVNLR